LEFPLIIRGKRIDESDIGLLRLFLNEHKDKSRYAISKLLAEEWGWYQANGRLKDRACRDILSFLARRNLIELPSLQREKNHIKKNQDISNQFDEIKEIDDSAIECPLTSLLPLSFKVVCQTPLEKLYNQLIRRYHYLGHKTVVGSYLKYLVYSKQGRMLSAIGWGSPVWKLKARDVAIGWTVEQRQKHLYRVANNQRFLILPWVNVRNLASHILSQNIRIINTDWNSRYGYRLFLLESFVDPRRFKGTCYRAANWIYIGQTQGFKKQGNSFEYHGKPKEVFLYPLERNFRRQFGCDNPLLSDLDHRYYLSLDKSEKPKKRGRRMTFTSENLDIKSLPPFDLQEKDIEQLDDEFKQFHSLFSPAYKRIEQEELSCFYLQGLMSSIERKSMEPIAINFMDTHRVRSMQHFMSSGSWYTEELSQTHKQESSITLGCPDGVLSVDSSEFVKKGKHSVGVARQWCGRLGKTENCQSGVFLGYCSSKGYGLIDRQLYLPEIWFSLDYKEKWQKCKIPYETEFKTKNEIALKLISENQKSGLFPAQWITCDSFFGRDSDFLDQIPDELYYFAEVPCNTKVFKEHPQCEVPEYSGRGRKPTKKICYPQPVAVSYVAKDPSLNWQDKVLAEGTKGPIIAKVTRLRLISSRDGLPGEECWLFIRKNLVTNEIKYFLSNAPLDTSFEEMCRVCMLRWPIEQCFKEGKSYLGMSHYEHRSWEAWHRHMTFVFIAQLFLTRIRHKFKKNSNTDITSGNITYENCFAHENI
jgi:SRSO17 transposase